MKQLVVLLITLCSLQLWADQSSTYTGKYFEEGSEKACLSHLDQLVSKARELELNVIESNCTQVHKGFRPQFLYQAEFGRRIMNKIVRLNKKTNCQALVAQATENFQSSSMDGFTGYCERGTLVLNYLRNKSYLKEINLEVGFETMVACEQYVRTVGPTLGEGITAISSFCRRVNVTDRTYAPRFIYEGLSKSLDQISEKRVKNIERCIGRHDRNAENFESAGLELNKSICHRSVFSKDIFEHLLYTRPAKILTQKHQGLSYRSERECLEAIEKVSSTYRSNGQKVFYNYCKGALERSYRPIIHFTR